MCFGKGLSGKTDWNDCKVFSVSWCVCHPAHAEISAQALQMHNYHNCTPHPLLWPVRQTGSRPDKQTDFFFFLFPCLTSPSYVVPSSLSHGIKLVNPMFRGYAQQVGPEKTHAIIPKMVGIKSLQWWCLFSEGKVWAQGWWPFCINLSDLTEHLGGIWEMWFLFQACLCLVGTKSINFLVSACSPLKLRWSNPL